MIKKTEQQHKDGRITKFFVFEEGRYEGTIKASDYTY